jgi:hypothetical protein
MHKRISWVVIATIALILGLQGRAFSAVTVVVGPSTCQPTLPHYANIQDAVNALPPNGTVLVCPGTYPEQVVITQPLTLKGLSDAGMDAAVITSPPGGVTQNFRRRAVQILVLSSPGVNISNITVDGSNNGIATCDGSIKMDGIVYVDSSGVIDHVTTRNQIFEAIPTCMLEGSGNGIWARTDTSGIISSVVIQNSSIHDFQGGGILATDPGTKFLIKNNIVRGRGFGPAQFGNGITISNAVGSILNNTVTDVISAADVFPDFVNSMWGIAVFCTQGVRVTSNTVSNTQGGIVLLGGVPGCPTADNNVVVQNNVSGTHFYDGVYVCGNNNIVQNNTITSSGQSGVHLTTSCAGVANGKNIIQSNVINEACAGLLVDPLSSGNIFTKNTFANVNTISVTGSTCGPLL